ncbi:MAG: twin-arginine translocation signal domain-containing protein [Gammaproteobacteria bacterium]|nr:twin-arginine translocation signal domain-containing protein [Gammaproteobacteria bacterium]
MKEKEQSESRRAFLKGAAAGAGAGAVAAFVSTAHAQSGSEAQSGAELSPSATQHGAFFNLEQATAVAAFVERLMPGAPDKPGATDADVLNYIDLALAGAYADQQHFYRRGLVALDSYCHATYDASFANLDAAQQDAVITALEDGSAEGFEWPSAQAFFQTLRTHTMEGMFADPIYGGNKDFAGWRLVGFPGAQFTYTPAEVQSTEPFSRGPIIGLQSQATRRG